MKTLVLLVLVAVGVSGCVVYPYGYHHGGAYRYDGDSRSYQQGSRGHDRARDSDRDGVPDRRDARPNDSRYR